MSVDSDNVEDFFDEELDHIPCNEEEILYMTSEDLDSVDSHSSTESKADIPSLNSNISSNSIPVSGASKFRTPVSKALQRVFRSRSSSPRIGSPSNHTRKESPNRSDGVAKESANNVGLMVHQDEAKLIDVENSFNTKPAYTAPKTDSYSDIEENEKFEPTETAGILVASSMLENMARKSMTQLHKPPPDSLDVKPIVTSRSFTCLQSSLFKGSKIDSSLMSKRRAEECFRSSRFKSKKKFGINKSGSSKDLPKVFISIDDDYPRSPEEEIISTSNFFDESCDDLCNTGEHINENDQLEASDKNSHSDKASDEDDFSDKEKSFHGPQKVTTLLKSWSIRVNKGLDSQVESTHVSKQQSQDSDPMNSSLNEDNVSPANSIDLPLSHETKVSPDSKLRKLRKFTLTLQGREKSKVCQDGEDLHAKGDDFSAKNMFNDMHSSEESLHSIPDKAVRKGRLRELSSFLSRENNAFLLRKEENNSEEGQGEIPLSIGPVSKNTKTFGEKVAEVILHIFSL